MSLLRITNGDATTFPLAIRGKRQRLFKAIYQGRFWGTGLMMCLVLRRSRCFYSMTLSLLGCVVIAGCGSESSGPQRVAMDGIVTRSGVPLASGTMSFSPQNGQAGPAVNAGIQNGKYQIPSAEGPTPGPYHVQINDAGTLTRDRKKEVEAERAGRARPASTPSAKPKSWQFKVDVPDETQFEHDFVLD